MSNKTYDILAWIGRLLLPALATLILAVFKIWELPYGEAIAATVSALAFFLNSILKKEANGYSPTGFNQETLDELFNGKGEDDE